MVKIIKNKRGLELVTSRSFIRNIPSLAMFYLNKFDNVI